MPYVNVALGRVNPLLRVLPTSDCVCVCGEGLVGVCVWGGEGSVWRVCVGGGVECVGEKGVFGAGQLAISMPDSPL